MAGVRSLFEAFRARPFLGVGIRKRGERPVQFPGGHLHLVPVRSKAKERRRTLLLHHFVTFRSDSRHFLWPWHGECSARP